MSDLSKYIDPRILAVINDPIAWNIRSMVIHDSHAAAVDRDTAEEALTLAVEAYHDGGLARLAEAIDMDVDPLGDLLVEALAGVQFMTRAESKQEERVLHRGIKASLDALEACLNEAVAGRRRPGRR